MKPLVTRGFYEIVKCERKGKTVKVNFSQLCGNYKIGAEFFLALAILFVLEWVFKEET